jgi:WD40 repeat protein
VDRRLAFANEEKFVGFMELPGGRPRVNIRGHAAMVTDLALSPDGSQLVSASMDGVVEVWDLTRRPTPKAP